MFLEMTCACGASIQMDGDNDTAALLLSHRFAEAHVSCGFVTPVYSDEAEKTVRHELKFKQKKIYHDKDEED
jgi:hypothetical protein